MQYLLAIDAGTTSVKAGLFSPDGRCLGINREEYQLDTPFADHAQITPEVYWQACIKTVKSILQSSGVDAETVISIGVSSQGETTITLDAQGQAIYPALVWLDNRAGRQSTILAEHFGKTLYDHTGIPEVIPTWSACKILWIRENEPGVFAKAAKFVLVQDYLIHRLTGQIVTDGSVSCTTMNYNIRENVWWKDVLDAIGIRENQLPDIVPPGTQVGTLSSEAAALLGLTTRTGVVTGGMDQSVGALGAGNIHTGIVSETTGAALTIQVSIPSPDVDKNKLIPVYCHSVPGEYLFVPVCPTGGMAYKWFRDTFAVMEIAQAEKDGIDSYDLLTALAADIPPGSDGLTLLPHLMGAYSPEPNPAARGSFTGFTLSHTRGHFARAILEGVAFLLKRNLEVLKNAGVDASEIRSTGGGARSPLWNQIKANVCNLPVVTLENEDTALLGDAILAGVAAGVFSSIEEGCRQMAALKDKIAPNAQAADYVAAYQRYCDLDRTLNDYYLRHYKNP